VIQAGEPIVLDIGGSISGYCSDITRTIWPTGPDDIRPSDEFTKLYNVLQSAQGASTAAVHPGVECQEIDRAGRTVIADAGMGELFIHRTGHGIGLEGHEDPYIVEGNEAPLEVGNTFSIEPGIYVEGKHGARIEDIVACAENGADQLNQVTRDLLVVRG
jgi:Xaa-Pro aminopeptidase